MFKDVVSSKEELRALFGEPNERAVLKCKSTLDEHARAFIAASPFLLLATSNAAGQCDVSPKGDGPGFVLVLDETHLVVPDRPGNNRIDSLTNILDNPHVGMIFVVPGRGDTLRVNGRASIVRDEEILSAAAVRGKLPRVGIGVEVEEAYLHCPKAFVRSGLWDASTWTHAHELPSFAQMLWDQVPGARLGATSIEQYTSDLANRIRDTLY
jgi:PPOX class probable FMN-dependent enzyme